MNPKERKVYELEKKIIRKFFPGLRPRPVKLMPHKTFDAFATANEPSLQIADYFADPGFEDDLENILKHELIHYELKDGGKHYHGHGKAFLRRAKQLGIVDEYVIDTCGSFEEVDHRPHRREWVRVPINEYKKRLEEASKELAEFRTKFWGKKDRMSVNDKIRSERLSKTVKVIETVYNHAVEKGETHVTEEVMTPRRGPRGKSLRDMFQEIKLLRREEEKLRKRQVSVGLTPKQQERLGAIVGQQMKLSEKAERDYDVELY